MNAWRLISILFLVSILSSAAQPSALPSVMAEDKAVRWFQSEYNNYFKTNQNDDTPPEIFDASTTPSVIKQGELGTELNAYVYDPAGIEQVYAEVGNRMNLMLDLNKDNRYTGYCNSNLPPGTYKVTIIAIDKAGNAARIQAPSLKILDPGDLNGNGIEDSLEKQKDKDLRVIVLHDDNLSGFGPASSQDGLKILPGSSMTLPSDKLNELSKIKGVKGIYKDQKLKVLDDSEDDYPDLSDNPSATAASSESLAGGSIDDPRKGRSLKGDGEVVALIDTGVDPNHKALNGKVVAFKDFVNNQTAPYDDNGHGTHCASLIAGTGALPGVAPDAKLVVVKVMDRDGACYLSDAIRALAWCLDNKDRYGIKVISFSVGGESPTESTSLLDEACNRMVDQGMVVCVAAGNSGPASSSIVIPGDAEKVITVGATDKMGTIFDRSSRGPVNNGEIKPDIVTIGVNVVSALAGSKDGYSTMSGTSMAVPQIAGAAALILEAAPDQQPSDVKRVLLKTADDLGNPGPDNDYGYGALNLTNALDGLLSKDLEAPTLDALKLSSNDASVGDPVMIEARASGDIKAISSEVVGPDRTLEIPMDDFDSNGIYSARWETSFWSPGDYKITAELQGTYGEVASITVPFRLLPR
ncbi:MAG: S8 family peptidase [Methanotrichaceae archaeon]